MRGFFRKLLRGICDLVDGDTNENETKQVEEGTQEAWISWISADDPTSGHIYIGGHKFRLERMVNPLSEADEQHSEKQGKGMRVGNAFQIDGQGCYGTSSTKDNEHVVPVLDLQPGERFIHGVPNEAVEKLFSSAHSAVNQTG
jgi:hypothetical protein